MASRDLTLEVVMKRREALGLIGTDSNPHIDVARRAVAETLDRRVAGGEAAGGGWLDALGGGAAAKAAKEARCRDERCAGCGEEPPKKRALCDVCAVVKCRSCVLVVAGGLGALVDALERGDAAGAAGAPSAPFSSRLKSFFYGSSSSSAGAPTPSQASGPALGACPVCRTLVRRWAFEHRVRTFRSPVVPMHAEVTALRQELDRKMPQARGLVMSLQASRGETPDVPQVGAGDGDHGAAEEGRHGEEDEEEDEDEEESERRALADVDAVDLPPVFMSLLRPAGEMVRTVERLFGSLRAQVVELDRLASAAPGVEDRAVARAAARFGKSLLQEQFNYQLVRRALRREQQAQRDADYRACHRRLQAKLGAVRAAAARQPP